MPLIKVSSDCLKAIKEYLVDIEDLNIGKFVEWATIYVMEHLDDFEDYIGLEEVAEEGEESDEGEGEEEGESEGESEEGEEEEESEED